MSGYMWNLDFINVYLWFTNIDKGAGRPLSIKDTGKVQIVVIPINHAGRT